MTEIDRLAAGEVSSTELVGACLARIAAVEGRVGAFVTITADVAREQAAAADAALAEGRLLGPLHGLPVAVKDNIATAGILTTNGGGHFLDNVPTADAPVVTRLREAGAVLLGKLTMHEYAYGGTSQNEHTGPCRNPWDLDCIPGGSSGGSGAAVAADEAVATLGTDTGGSVRIPASVNGVTGIRATFGRVPVRGIFPIAISLDTCGPLARHALDVARLLDALSGYDVEDPLCQEAPAGLGAPCTPGIDRGVDGLRIGIPRNFFWDDCDPEVEALVRAGAETLAELGATLVEVEVPGAELGHGWVATIVRSEALALHRQRMAEAPEKFSSEVLRRLRTGESITGADYAEARQGGRVLRRTFARLFEGVDLLLHPNNSIPAPLADDSGDIIETTRLLTQLTYASSIALVPSVSAPCGFTAKGLPVGMQLTGAAWRDDLVLRAAYAYQQVTDWHERRPALA